MQFGFGSGGRGGGGAYVFNVAEGIVDRDHLGAILLASSAADQPADAAEAGDTHLDHG